jgi:hypothetical protein
MNHGFDERSSLDYSSPIHRYEFESEMAIDIFVKFLEAHALFKRDSPRFGRCGCGRDF